MSFSPALQAAAGNRRIDHIELWPLVYPMKGYFKFFHGGANQGGRAAVLVRIRADDGAEGWGQAVPISRWSAETLETCVTAIRDYFAPALKGHDPADISGAHSLMDSAIAPTFSTGMPIARAGIDLALWDLAGKVSGKPLHQLWNLPAPRPLTISWTVNVRSLDEVDKVMGVGMEAGYANFNIKVGPDPAADVALAKAVRRRAPDGFLWADANGGYEDKTALEAAPRLRDAGVDVLEAPLRPNHIRGYQALVKQNALPILMDEGVVSQRDLEEFTALDMMHGMAAKPARCAGLTTCLSQIAFLKKQDMMWLGSGLTDPDHSLAATLHAFGAHALAKPAALNGPQFLDASIITNPFEVKDGQLAAPAGPGLGVEVDIEKVKALSVEVG